MTKQYYRYPGSHPYRNSEIDRLLFYGRDEEANLLYHTLRVEKLVVLYARSGVGKSSLVNAGLTKRMEKEREAFSPYFIRFNKAVSPLKGLYQSLKRYSSLLPEGTPWEDINKNSLWEFFKDIQERKEHTTEKVESREERRARRKQANYQPLLILDQFEEFFVLFKPHEREEFVQQLADLVHGLPPLHVRTAMEKEDSPGYDTSPPIISVLILIRSEALGELEEMSEKIPSILRNRIRLTPLSKEQAEKAIVEPARHKDPSLRGVPFSFSQNAIEEILTYLSRRIINGKKEETNAVNPSQLQLICNYFERKTLPERKREQDGSMPYEIDLDGIGGKEGLEGIIMDFYERQISIFPLSGRLKIRSFIETGLITDSRRRTSLQADEIKSKFEIEGNVLKKLIEGRLIRTEKRLGGEAYELSHDTLIDPILSSSIAYSQEESKKQEKRKSIGVMIYAFLAVVIISVVVGIWVNYSSTQEYNNSLKEAKEYRNVLLRKAEKFRHKGEFTAAIEIYQQLIKETDAEPGVFIELGTIYNQQGLNEKTISLYREAEKKGKNSSYLTYLNGLALLRLARNEEAAIAFKKANKIDPNLDLSYLELGKLYLNQEKYQDAIEPLTRAEEKNKVKSIKPLLYLGRAYIYSGNYEMGYETYCDLVEKNPDFAYAFENFVKAFQGNPGKGFHKRILDKAANFKAEGYNYDLQLGRDYEKQGFLSNAIQIYRRAIGKQPEKPEAVKSLGLALFKSSKMDKVIKTLTPLTQGTHQDVEVAFVLGKAHLKRNENNDAEDAVKYLKVAYELSGGKSHEVIPFYGNALDQNANYAEIITLLEGKQTNDLSLVNLLAKAYREEKQYAKALVQLEKVYQITGDDYQVNLNIAELHYLLRNYKAYYEQIGKAYSLKPESGLKNLDYAGVALFIGEYEEAADVVEPLSKGKNLSWDTQYLLKYVHTVSLLFEEGINQQIKGELDQLLGLFNNNVSQELNVNIPSSINAFLKKIPETQKHRNLLHELINILSLTQSEKADKLEGMRKQVSALFEDTSQESIENPEETDANVQKETNP